jgi:hypothetical protein
VRNSISICELPSHRIYCCSTTVFSHAQTVVLCGTSHIFSLRLLFLNAA